MNPTRYYVTTGERFAQVRTTHRVTFERLVMLLTRHANYFGVETLDGLTKSKASAFVRGLLDDYGASTWQDEDQRFGEKSDAHKAAERTARALWPEWAETENLQTDRK